MTLAIAFVLLFAVVCWFVAGARGYWPVKFAAILAMTLLGWQVYSALAYRTGWPTRDSVPSQAQFLAGSIDEPRAIYLWLIVDGKPRAYQLPYSRQLHRQVAQANGAAKSGRPIGVARLGKNGRGQKVPRSAVRFYQLPNAPLTRKG